MDDKRKALYDALSGEYNLGSYEEFTEKLNDENKRKALYDAAGQDYNLGTYEEYSTKLGFEPNATKEDNAAVDGSVPMFDDEPQAVPAAENLEENSRKLRGLWANFKESSKGLWAGLKGYAGEQLNMFSGSSREEQAALNDIEQLEQQGIDVTQYLADKEKAEFQKAYGMSKEEFMALDKKERKELIDQATDRMVAQQPILDEARLKEQIRQQTNQKSVEDAFRKALEAAGGDMTKAKAILREQAADKTKGDVLIEEATETMNNLREPEGFAGWVGNLLPQMIPATATLALNYLTKGKASGLSKAIGFGTMGGLTLSTAGMSMIEARNAGATNLEVWLTGIADGAIEIISEKIPFDRVTKRVFSSAKANVAKKLGDAVLNPKGRAELEKLLSDANEKLGGRLFSKKNVGEWLKDTAYEAAGEFTAEALQTITTMIYENPEDYPTISEVLANGWEGAKAGLFMGAITGGASHAAAHSMNKDRRMAQGYVDVAQMENEDGDVEVVEVVGEDPQTGNITILHNDELESVSREKIGDRFRFSYEEFENARLREMEDEAIESGNVTEGQIQGLEDNIARDIDEIKALAPEMTESEISAVLQSEMAVDPDTPLGEAVAKYQEDVARHGELVAVKREADAAKKEAIRTEIETAVGQRFWVQESGEDDGSGIVPVSETVEEVVYADGTVGYVVGMHEKGYLAMVFTDGTKGFTTREEITEKENSGEILSNTVMGLDDYLAVKMDIDEVTREKARMQEEHALSVEEMIATHPQGSVINVGTEEAKIEVPVIAPPTKDGVIVQMPDGTTPMLTWEDVAHAEKKEITPKTNAQLNQSIVDEYRVAYTPAVPAASQPAQQKEEQVKRTSPANPLPLKADGSVDQTALWNKDPEGWAKWNDEKRQDGGADSLAYVTNAIAIEQAKMAELQAVRSQETDFDRRDALDAEIATAQERIDRLVAIQQGYLAQPAVADAVQNVQPEPEPQTEEERAAAEEQRREPFRKRAKELGEKLGVKINIAESLADVREEQPREAIMRAEVTGSKDRYPGWYNRDTGEVTIYLPHVASVTEVDKTLIHEIVAHKGLRGLLGKEGYNVLCDAVWDMMTEAERAKYMAYPGVNGDKRLAADEYIARFAEGLDLEQSRPIWNKIAEAVQKILNSMGIRLEVTKEDLADLIAASYMRLQEQARAAQTENAPVVEEVTEEIVPEATIEQQAETGADVEADIEEVTEESTSPIIAAAQQDKGGISFNVTTEEPLQDKIRKFAQTEEGKATGWTEDDIESIIAETESLIDAIHRSSTGNEFYDEFAYKEPTIRVDWRDGEAKPIVTWTRANIEYKYDMSADLLCINNEGLEAVLSSDKMVALMEMFVPEKKAKKGEPEIKFTSEDYLELYNTLKDLGFVVPCKGCFDAAGRFKMLPSVAQKFAAEVNALIDERNKDPKAFDEKLKAKPGEKTVGGLPATAATKSAAIAAGVAGDNLTEHVKWTQLMSADGQTKMLSDWGGIFRAWQRTGAGRPKDKLLPEPYYGDIVSSVSTIIGKYGEKTPSFRDTLVNQGTGLRRNSHSEFRPVLAIDEIQFMRDAFIRNLTVFKYMKELDDVRLFGKMGVKFNMSFFPEYVPGTKVAGLDKDGNYIASEESVGSREFPYQGEDGKRHYDGMKGWEEAQKHINKDVSLSSVIFSIPHLLKALTDVPTPSDMRGIWGSLIPFHSSGATTASLAMQGLGMARANGVGHGFSEAFYDYGKGVTNFEAVQNDRFGEGWHIVSGTKAGTDVEPGHKLEFVNGNHYYNKALGVHLFASGYILDSELPAGVLGENGELDITNDQKKDLMHKFTIDYNDKVRELKGPYAYKDAADFYIAELPKLGLIPRFDFEVSEEKFLEMCEAANVDPRHPKLGWKGEGNSWSPIDSEAYYSLFCDYGMTDPATGEWAPHMPVGYVNEEGEREFRLPDNAVEIVKEGLDRFSEVRRSENARIDEAIEAFAERSVEKGRISQESVDKVLGKEPAPKKSGVIDLVEEAKKADLRHRMSSENTLVPGHKKGQPMLSDAEMMSGISFRVTKNTKATIEKWCDKADMPRISKEAFIDYLDDAFEDTTEQLCAAKWYLNGKINLPHEDEYKVRDAVKVAKQNKVDALSYASPMDILNTFGQPKSKVKPINPDTIKEFSNKKELPEGIVVYDVQDDFEGQAAVRKIIDTHWGEDANPWCLAARVNGDLDRAKEMWQYYSKYPKRIAFRNGRLLAFYASANDKTWWDRNDEPHTNIPYSIKTKEGEYEVSTNYELKEGNKKAKKVSVGKSDKKGRTAYFVGNRLESAGIQDGERNLFYSSFAAGATLSDSTYGGVGGVEIQYGPTNNVTQISVEKRPMDGPVFHARIGYGPSGVRSMHFVEGKRAWDIRYGYNGDRIFVGGSQVTFNLNGELENVYHGAYTMQKINDEYYEFKRGTNKIGVVKQGEKASLEMMSAFGEDGVPVAAILDFINEMGWERSAYPYPNPADADVLRNDVEVREMVLKAEDDINEVAGRRYLSSVPAISFRMTTEMKEIKEKAQADGTFMKAPNGQPTNLTEEQWLMVRTKNFIKWFGDWLKPQRVEKLRQSESISLDGNEYVGKYELNKESAFNYILNELSGSYVNKDTGDEIKVSYKGAKKVTSHGYKDPIHLASIVHIPRMIQEAIFITEEPNLKRKNEFETYRYYVCGVNIDGEEYTAKIVVGVRNNETYYDHQLSSLEKGKLIDSRDLGTTRLAEDEFTLLDVKDKRLISILQNDFSKVVDENGEPKVVYHQTNQKIYVNRETGENWDELGWKEKMEWDNRDDWEDYWEEQDFNTFSRVNARTTNEFDGFFFAPEYDEYHEYGDRTIAAFVNIKNPASREDYNIDSRYNDAGRNERIRLQEAGFDGVIRMDGDNVDEYIAFEPNQIKSATDNNGDFNPKNNNISFRITPEQDKAYMDAVESGDMDTAQGMVDEAAAAAGYTIRGDHGRVSKFTIFDKEKANPEGNWGQGFYFTNNEEDVEENYATVDGPDLEAKIEREVEKRMAMLEEDEDYDPDESEVDEFTIREEVEDEFITAEPNVVHAALKMENPFVVGHGMVEVDEHGLAHYDMEETFLGVEYETDEDGEADYDTASGTLVDLVEALNEELSNYEGVRINAYDILSNNIDGMTASQFETEARELLENSQDYLLNDDLAIMTSEILRAAIERAGFDGIIDNTVNRKFGEARQFGQSMSGVDANTRHYVVFKPNQIKDTDPVTYDEDGNVIPLSKRFNPKKDSISFRMRTEEEDAMEFAQSAIDDCLSRYNDVAEVKVFPVNEETAERFGYTLEELKKTGGEYLEDEDLIAIFANEDYDDSAIFENIFFHESIHKIASFFTEFVEIGEWLWSNAGEVGLQAVKTHIEENYKPSQYNEEMLTFGMSLAMSIGVAGKQEKAIPQIYRSAYRKILNEIGYEPEKESRRAEERISDSSRKEAHRNERKADEGGRGKEGETRTAELSTAERRVIGEYFPEFNKEEKEGVSFRTSLELDEEFGDAWRNQQNEDGRHSTQVANTKSTYEKIGHYLEDAGMKGASILDASSGLGLGTQALREMGFNVDDVEPFPSENREAPTFSSYADIDKQYDVVISNAVLNVIPDDWRADVLHQMADAVKEGGKMIINTRPASNIAQQGVEGKTRITLDSPSEILVKRGDRIAAYQKGFTSEELAEWIKSELGEGWRVEKATKKNSGISGEGTAIVIKERGGVSFRTYEQEEFDDTNIKDALSELYDDLEFADNGIYGADDVASWINSILANYVGKYESDLQNIIDIYEDASVEFAADFRRYGGRMIDTEERDAEVASMLSNVIAAIDNEDNVSFRVTGTPTDEVVANGLTLTPAQTAEVAANIFDALPGESREKITDGLNGNILGLQDAIMQIPASLATKENWNEEDRAMADVVAEEMTKMAGEMTRPFSAPEALWLLYNNLNKGNDLISQASRALVQRNLGFDEETLERQEEAKQGVSFRMVGDATANAKASMYNRGAVNVWTRLKESFVDMQASVEELVSAIEKATGKVAKGFENILLALNQQSSKGLAAMESYEQRFLMPMFDEVRKIMDKAYAGYDTVVRYVILKHGLERNKKLAQRDAKAHYQEIYDEMIAKVNSMDDRQKRTYLTNAQLQDADAKAKLATLKAADTSAFTEEEKNAHKRELAKAKEEAKKAKENLERAQKINSMSEQELKDELDGVFKKIENGTDSVYKELRKNDYSGISSMFYDQLGVNRKDYSTEEEYQAALMLAKNDRFSSLEEVEEQAEGEVESFEGRVDTKELWKRINAATKETLRQQYEANMISKDQYESLRNMFEYYVPLRGFKDNTAEDMYTYYRKPNSTGYTKPILGAEGRKTEAESPFGWIAAMAGSAIASNVKNEAKLALYYFVSNRPDNGIATLSRTWFVHTPGDVDANGKKIFKPAYPPFSEDLSSDAAKQAYEDWQEQMRELQKQGLAYEAGQRLNLGNAVVNISDANKPEHVVTVKVAGKDYTIVINGNPRAAQAINGELNLEGTADDYSAIFGPVLRWMSSVNTSYNPEFWITNLMRDMAFTWMAVNTKEDPAYRKKFSKNYWRCFRVIGLVAKNEKGTIGNSYIEDMYKDFVKHGGVTGYTQIKDSETWEKEIDNYLRSTSPESLKNGRMMRGMKTFFHAAHRFGESLEQVSRFAAFLTSREMGKSINEAIADAKEITVNFNRKGSGKMISLEESKYLTDKNGQPLSLPARWAAVGLSSIAPLGRRTIMFFNAAVQGLNSVYRLWQKNPKRLAGWTLAYFAIGVLNAVLHALLDDDDDYLDIPQYERRNSLMLGGNGAYLKWALPQEARAFYALGDLAVETVLGRNPHQNIIGETLKIATEVLPVNPAEGWKAFVPSVAIPAVELMLNEDYKGAPIYNEQKWLSEEERKRTAKWSSAYQGTGAMYKGIAQGLNYVTGGDKHDAGKVNLQPEKMEYIVQSAFGGTIRTADKFINTIWAMFDPEEDVTVRQTPFLNRILTLNDERFKNVHVNEVFDYYKADADHALTLEKRYTKDRDLESLNELRKSEEYQWAKVYRRYKKALDNLKEKLKVAEGTAEKKELMRQQDELKRRVIKEISEL